MPTEEGFRQFLRPYVKRGIPFLAYWHPAGMGLLRLDEVQVPTRPPIELQQKDAHVPTRAHRLSKRGLRAWEKNLARLRRLGRVVTVEFDGENLTSEEGFEL